MRALSFAGLVGKWVRAERPARPHELTDSNTVGAYGQVQAVRDLPGRQVLLIFEDGTGLQILPSQSDWRFYISDTDQPSVPLYSRSELVRRITITDVEADDA